LILRTLLEKNSGFILSTRRFFKYLENRDYLAQIEETRAQHTVHSI